MWPCFGIQALLVVAVTLSPVTAENDVTGEDVYPPLWDIAPENLLDFPVKDNKIVISAWSYQDRLGVYKSLLNASAKYFDVFGPQNSGNILWGLPLQHGWQFHTGRLADHSGGTSCGYKNGELLCQSVRSWWSCMNYYLAIIPFLGAVEAGLFGQLPYEIEILPPEEQKDDFCYSVKDCWSRMPKLMDDWKAFFEYLLSTEHKAVSSASFSSFKLDDALGLMWKAHTSSIAYALPKFQDRLKYLSDPEANFGVDWANGVDFIAATHFSTDFPTTNSFQVFLPQRMLVEEDVLPFISDFSPQQNNVLVSLRALHEGNKLTVYDTAQGFLTYFQEEKEHRKEKQDQKDRKEGGGHEGSTSGGLLLKLWQQAMSTEAGRKLGRKLIESLASSQKLELLDLVGI